MGDSLYRVLSKNTRAKAYEYYSDVISYPQRYPDVYAYVKELNRSTDTFEVDMFLKLNFADNQYSNSVRVTVRYALSPPTEIIYRVIDGYGKGRIKNSITIKEPTNLAIQQGCKCEIEVNHLPMDILSPEPHGLEETDPMHAEYIGKGLYLQAQDQIYLEGNSSLQEFVTKCPRCAKNALEYTGLTEKIGNTVKREFKCGKCGYMFYGMSYGSEI